MTTNLGVPFCAEDWCEVVQRHVRRNIEDHSVCLLDALVSDEHGDLIRWVIAHEGSTVGVQCRRKSGLADYLVHLGFVMWSPRVFPPEKGIPVDFP